MKKLLILGAGLISTLAIVAVPTIKTYAAVPPLPACNVSLPIVPPTVYYVHCDPYYDPGTGVTFNAFTLRAEDLGL